MNFAHFHNRICTTFPTKFAASEFVKQDWTEIVLQSAGLFNELRVGGKCFCYFLTESSTSALAARLHRQHINISARHFKAKQHFPARDVHHAYEFGALEWDRSQMASRIGNLCCLRHQSASFRRFSYELLSGRLMLLRRARCPFPKSHPSFVSWIISSEFLFYPIFFSSIGYWSFIALWL